jgi:hypothetical protein
MKSFKDFLGPEATKQQDAAEIARQKKHLGDKAKEYYDQGAREGGQGAAVAKGITFDLAKKNIKEVKEPTGKLKDACWTGYTAVGMKNKGGRQVPNCVPVKEDGEGGGFAPAATNVVGGGAIAGSGGAGGEPGVSKKRNPLMSFFKRKQPKM